MGLGKNKGLLVASVWLALSWLAGAAFSAQPPASKEIKDNGTKLAQGEQAQPQPQSEPQQPKLPEEEELGSGEKTVVPPAEAPPVPPQTPTDNATPTDEAAPAADAEAQPSPKKGKKNLGRGKG